MAMQSHYTQAVLGKKKLPTFLTLHFEWKESIIVPVHKMGDKTDYSNYRRISLLSTSYKI
jgi:hypothetical protein